jgi:hypothetical protein
MSGKPSIVDQWAWVAVPALILDSGTAPWMSAGADALASALPYSERRTLEGQTHDVASESVADVPQGFFGNGGAQ